MSSFNFSSTAGASQSAIKPTLKANEIHEVTFDEAISENIQGVKDPSKVYKVLKLRFSNESGRYEHTIFEPSEQDFERGSREFTGKDGNQSSMPLASNVESMMLLLKHVMDAVVPEISKKIDSGEIVLGGKNWDELRNNVVKVLDKGKGAVTNIKLLADSKGAGRFPGFFTSINKEDKPYVRNNFIGKNIGFTDYEKSKIEKAATAKPTSFVPEVKEDNIDLNMDFDLSNL